MGYEFLADLAAAIEIPADGTLSKTIYRDESSKAVLFAFDAGQELSDHTAASPAVIHVISGRLAIGLGDDRVEAGANSWIHMDANLTHSVEALEPSVMLLTLVGR